MQECSSKKIDIKIITENYITSQYLDFNHMLGGNWNPEKYDIVIGNPPYMKISKDAPKRQQCRQFVMERLICISFLRQWDYLT